jgi:phosphatidylserine/phosphatidylglycerophosphate/cardiolipin synthase-like enzyme
LLKPEVNCWKVERADRFSVLLENDAYFEALRSSLHKAQRSILVLGWQFDPRTRLAPELMGHARGDEIGHLLRRLVMERPQLEARLLIWRSPLPIAWSQGFYPQRTRAWFRKKPMNFRLDRPRPPGACHHQKVIVIDDQVAFWGGGDIATDRWDTLAHRDDEPLRTAPSGRRYVARHEVMGMASGPAAKALADLARRRWLDATGEGIPPVGAAAGDAWPDGVEPDLYDARVGIARTEPRWRGGEGVRECERLHLDAFAQARRLIYLENQYVTSPLIAAALAERLRAPDGPEVVIVSTAKSPSWFDRAAMDRAREVLLHRLRQADRYGRLSAWAPLTEGGRDIIVHSKVSLIDDRLLRIGSANLNNRSNGFDTECDVAVESERPGDAASELICGLRAHLLGHFLGVDAGDFERAYDQLGSVAAAIEALNSARRLKPLGVVQPSVLSRLIARWQLGDPTSPEDAWRPWRRARLWGALRALAAAGAAGAS